MVVKIKGVDERVRLLYLFAAIGLITGSLIRTQLIETIQSSKRPSLSGMLKDYAEILPLFKGEIGRVALISSLGFASMSLIDPFIQLYVVESLEIDPAYWGLANLIASIAGLMSQPLAGYLGDKVGRREVIFLSFSFSSLGYLLLLMSPKGSEGFVLASLLVSSIMPRFPALFALRADVMIPEIRGRVDAMSRLISNLMLSASNVAGGKLYDFSPSFTMATSALMAALISAASF